jgi:hypothetical protein
MEPVNIYDKPPNLTHKIGTFPYGFCNYKTSSSDGVLDVGDVTIPIE